MKRGFEHEIYSLKQALVNAESTTKKYVELLTKEIKEKDNCKIAFKRIIQK